MMGSGGASIALLGVRGGFLMEVNCLTGFQAEISRRLVDASACCFNRRSRLEIKMKETTA